VRGYNEKKGLGARFAVSIISIVGWIIFLILWLFFYASNYDIYQNIAIIIISLLILGLIKGIVWMTGHK
jgi:hypothetical protein